MACPPEDSSGYNGSGTQGYQESVLDNFDEGEVLPSDMQQEMGRANNISAKKFDPYKFSLKEARLRVKEAVGGKASVAGGELKFVHYMGGSGGAMNMFATGGGYLPNVHVFSSLSC